MSVEIHQFKKIFAWGTNEIEKDCFAHQMIGREKYNAITPLDHEHLEELLNKYGTNL
jgi:hypothetical protein